MKKTLLTLGTIMICSTLLTACSKNKDNNSSNDTNTNTVNKAVDKTDSRSESKKSTASDVSFKNDVLTVDGFTFKFNKTEVRKGYKNTKVLVIFMDVTNNTDKEKSPREVITMRTDVNQKTETANKRLYPGMLDYEGREEPLKAEQDAFRDELLPKKTTHAVMLFELVNDTPVTLKFKDSGYQTAATKTIQVK